MCSTRGHLKWPLMLQLAPSCTQASWPLKALMWVLGAYVVGVDHHSWAWALLCLTYWGSPRFSYKGKVLGAYVVGVDHHSWAWALLCLTYGGSPRFFYKGEVLEIWQHRPTLPIHISMKWFSLPEESQKKLNSNFVLGLNRMSDQPTH